MDDIPALPYLEAILREVFRWMPSVPAGVFHRSIVDDEYNGYTIPAGSIIVAVSLLISLSQHRFLIYNIL